MTDVEISDYLASALRRLEGQYHSMAATIDPPVWTTHGEIGWPRYEVQSANLLCFLKGVKLISTLNAALSLLRQGYTQEVGVLCRVSEECREAIMFMIQRGDGDKLSTVQERYSVDFFQEEFADPSAPLTSRQKRERVPRNRIAAAIAQVTKAVLNPSDAQNISKIIHGALSGYVHGAYPHIMELYGGSEPHFHMNGMPNTPRQAEFRRLLVNDLYRTIIVSILISRSLGRRDIESEIRNLLEEFEVDLQCLPESDAETLVRSAKSR